LEEGRGGDRLVKVDLVLFLAERIAGQVAGGKVEITSLCQPITVVNRHPEGHEQKKEGWESCVGMVLSQQQGTHGRPQEERLQRLNLKTISQVKAGTLHLDANLALLRFYQYNPSTAKVEVARKVGAASPSNPIH